MNQIYPCSLVLASHGSEATPCSNRPQFELAETLYQSGLFAKVLPAFLHGQPAIENVLSQLPAGDVVVVPLMTSEGYYSQTVFPKRLQSNPGIHDYRILLTPAIGTQPAIQEFVQWRVVERFREFGFDPTQTTVVVVGHGTRRNPNSGTTTYDLAHSLRATFSDLQVTVGFLDQDPEIGHLAKQIKTPNILVIPFLISRGPHTTVDLPEAFGLPTGAEVQFPTVHAANERTVVLDTPVGMYPEIAELCLELATDQLLPQSTESNGEAA